MILPARYDSLNSVQRRKVRDEYARIQEGRCFYCQNLLTEAPAEAIASKPIRLDLFPPGFLENPVHLQHSHTTGLTEGAVHAYCNAVLWQYEKR